ncbi:hypothetical protein [Nannocystis sp. SCPEA4]|uniref:hypothetical protein n=1 Tax=Nannocystis sp. SCPEA4 TaxID=2996787 RepID=UPI0022716B33|nr:hypothetical protein [Nannocystis sp. SCPEA4]MCY1055469.1 hypothetical protein [Nannocystis sp. SCPEA4]
MQQLLAVELLVLQAVEDVEAGHQVATASISTAGVQARRDRRVTATHAPPGASANATPSTR